MTRDIRLTVNGRKYFEENVETRLLLVHFIRDRLGLTGTHVGCDSTNCGACTIFFNGKAVKSCTVLAVRADSAEITTIEGIGSDGKLHPVQEGFWERHGLQCGYCTPGMIISGIQLLERYPEPTDEIVRRELEGNLCRCTGYQNIVEAILWAGKKLNSEMQNKNLGEK